MSGLSIADFPRVFASIHGHPPFEWQKRLLQEVDEKGWPSCVAAPTGAGKTAVLDIALFHLALELSRGARPRRAPTRIVFAVDRRLIVDQAFERAKKIGKQLTDPQDDLLKRLAGVLGSPLHVEEIRGGIPREDDWARTPVQPTILCTTVDQLGSRLLFRGYGVSESMAPVHAGLLGQDALILLDEAHLSAAFEQTLGFLSSRRNPAKPPGADLAIVAPWAVCTLTATPRDHVARVFELDAHERAEESIAQRLRAAKNVEFNEVEDALGSSGHAQAFVDAAERLANPGETIAVVVNRVKLARAIRERLAERHHAILLTGRVRPLERDRLIEEYRSRLFSGLRLESEDAPLFVVATQCIEAGADFDFGGMVTQIAPLDCLRQRFGRLDRLGWRGRTEGVVIASSDEVAKSAKPDPIYDDRAKKTWEWLLSKAREPSKGETKRLDFGPNAMGKLIARDPEGARDCAAAAKPAPVLRAADVALLTMTHPRPHPDPHLPLFLHGDPRAEADVAIVWRADLPDPPDKTAKGIVACLPPKAAEALAVPLWEARQWLTGSAQADVSDVEGAESGIERARGRGREALRWRGAEDPQTRLVEARELRPGDTIIVPAEYGGCDKFGWAPESEDAVADLGDEAATPYEARRAVLRLHPKLWPLVDPPWGEVAGLLQDHGQGPAKALVKALEDLVGENSEIGARLGLFAGAKLERPIFPYDGDGEPETPTGAILVAPRGLANAKGKETGEAITDGDDAGSFRPQSLPLEIHLAQVEARAREFAEKAGLSPKLTETIAFAARFHDSGKADPRFQTYLAGGVEPGPKLLAKSGHSVVPAAVAAIRAASGLPKNWRHEALSVRLAARALAPNDPRVEAALALYLIGSHHGQGRPFFRHDDPWDDCERDLAGQILPSGAGPQRLDFDWRGRDWAELFEELNDRYGAWGLAYLEAVLRLSDHRASEEAERPAS